jgi:hypothetical protein
LAIASAISVALLLAAIGILLLAAVWVVLAVAPLVVIPQALVLGKFESVPYIQRLTGALTLMIVESVGSKVQRGGDEGGKGETGDVEVAEARR